MKKIIILLAVLIGCSEGKKPGTVVKKIATKDTVYMIMAPLISTDGKTTTTDFQYYNVHDGGDFILRVRDEKGFEQNCYVTQEVYNSHSINDKFVSEGFTKDTNNDTVKTK